MLSFLVHIHADQASLRRPLWRVVTPTSATILSNIFNIECRPHKLTLRSVTWIMPAADHVLLIICSPLGQELKPILHTLPIPGMLECLSVTHNHRLKSLDASMIQPTTRSQTFEEIKTWTRVSRQPDNNCVTPSHADAEKSLSLGSESFRRATGNHPPRPGVAPVGSCITLSFMILTPNSQLPGPRSAPVLIHLRRI